MIEEKVKVPKFSIDRKEHRNYGHAVERLKYCLDCLENQAFKKGVGWSTEITTDLTLEEVIGALVSSEQELLSIYEREEDLQMEDN